MDPGEYHKMAAAEDNMWYYRALHGHIGRAVEAIGGTGRLLDAGCGTGGLMQYLHRQSPQLQLTGVDLSELACTYARRRNCGEVIQADLTALPLGDAGFDVVVSSDVLYHIGDDRQALAELVRVLRPGGLLVVNVPAHPWLWSYHDVAVHGQRRYARADLLEKLRERGLAVSMSTHWNLLLLPLIVVRRKCWPAPRSGSDVQAYAPWLNALLGGVMAFESLLLRLLGRLPAGSSLLVVARKPA